MGLGKDATILLPARRLLQAQNQVEMDKIVKWFNQKKHNKGTDEALDIVGALTFIGNVCNDVFSPCSFGFFEGIQRKRFEHEFSGRFRVAHGAVQPFNTYLEYHGKESFSDFQPFVLDIEHRTALSLEPLGFWDICPKHGSADDQHFFLFDCEQSAGFEYKASGYECSIRTQNDPTYSSFVSTLREWKIKDPRLQKVSLDRLEEPE
jgi:hypothetical protein